MFEELRRNGALGVKVIKGDERKIYYNNRGLERDNRENEGLRT